MLELLSRSKPRQKWVLRSHGSETYNFLLINFNSYIDRTKPCIVWLLYLVIINSALVTYIARLTFNKHD
jgi:hypothetical protein